MELNREKTKIVHPVGRLEKDTNGKTFHGRPVTQLCIGANWSPSTTRGVMEPILLSN